MLFWTRHANFRCLENYIYDPSARIINNPLNSTIFWTRQTTRRLVDSAPGRVKFYIKIIVAYFDEASSQLDDAYT